MKMIKMMRMEIRFITAMIHIEDLNRLPLEHFIKPIYDREGR